MMFTNLLTEAASIQKAWGYGLLEALEFIYTHKYEYSDEIQQELKEFMSQGAEMFA